MNRETQLKLQAYLDDELAPAELREIAELLADNAEAKALCTELQATKDLVRGNELEMKLTESREFYWSKIAREIDRNERAQTAPERTYDFSWLRRWVLPLAGVAVLAALLTVWLQIPSSSPSALRLAETPDIETTVDDAGMNSFRSESEGISVVWVNSR
jgi:anti-sigma factor RsiW